MTNLLNSYNPILISRYFGALALLFIGSPVCCAQDWKLKKETEGIKIYTRSIPNSNLKAMKATLSSVGTPAQMESILLDVDGMKDWIYSTKFSSIVKRVNKHEIIYYSEKDIPWPASNRDIVIRLKITQDTDTRVMTATMKPADNLVPEKKCIVRITKSDVEWTITPIGRDSINIVYTAETDPGGAIPAWIISLFSSRGAIETFKKLKLQLEKKQ